MLNDLEVKKAIGELTEIRSLVKSFFVLAVTLIIAFTPSSKILSKYCPCPNSVLVFSDIASYLLL